MCVCRKKTTVVIVVHEVTAMKGGKGFESRAYHTVPASRADETDRARSMSLVNTAATRPYFVLLALSITCGRLLKLNIHCTGPKICRRRGPALSLRGGRLRRSKAESLLLL